MKLKVLTVQNFRNFNNITIELSNKNIIFGMNDVGKSNLIYALRLLFDPIVRNREILDTDFHEKNTSQEIIITCTIEIEDFADDKKLIAKVREARSENTPIFHICLKITEDESKCFISELFWGADETKLLPIPTRGTTRSELDYLFNCIFIPSHIELEKSFTDFKSQLLKQGDWGSANKAILDRIDESTKKTNKLIEKLPSVKQIQSSLNTSLKNFDESYQVKIASQQSVGGLHNQLSLYTHENNNPNPQLYPASGDGRKKKIMYAMITHLLKQGENSDRQIPLLLIEEPENHLFLSAQVDLSEALFKKDDVSYLFMVTHSPQLFHHINQEANLIRLYKEHGKSTSNSMAATITSDYEAQKNILLEQLSHCFFVERVLLVEGPSEKLLFDWILDKFIVDRNLRQKIYVMPVLGAHFLPYWKLLSGLGIKVVVKTDNDVKNNNNSTFSYLGLNRCINLYNEGEAAKIVNLESQAGSHNGKETKQELFKRNQSCISAFKSKHIYLSEIDLEHDLAKAISGHDVQIKWLQEKKWQNMFEFIKYCEANALAQQIYEHPLFECLQEIQK